jgi:Secretion system C-terminal sorting domain
MFLNFNSMKIIYSIVLFFAFFLNLNAQDIFEPSAEFFATGRFRAYYGTAANTRPPESRVTFNEYYDFFYARINCNQVRSILSEGKLGLDSFIIVNGLITKRLRMSRVNQNAPFIESNRDEYFYSNNRTTPDSIVTLPAVNNKKSVRAFTYDVANRITVETSYQDSLGRKIFYSRATNQYNADGHIVKNSYEYFYLGNWLKQWEHFITWQSGKLIAYKWLDYEYTLTPDTSYFTPKYVGATNRVDTFSQTYKDKVTGKIFPDFARFVNVSQNAKGYPTKVLYQALDSTGKNYNLYQEWTYTYYPGDTLVRQKTTKEGVFSGIVNYEYCGIPTLTPTTELSTLAFNIYPNPTNQVLNIEIPENTEGPSVEIFNAMGNVVSKTKQLNIDVSDLPTGIYFVQIKTKDRVGVKRFIVNR